MTFPITALLGIGAQLIEKLIPDPKAKDEAKLKLLELQQTGALAQLSADVELAKAQLDVNRVDAAAPDLFRAGWRPFIGWVCGFGLAFQFVIRPLANWTIAISGYTTFLPSLELETLMTLLFGMLGLGAYRTYEKTKISN